ncbi:MAG: glycosyltransferase family 4 protein [Candidatus Moranbacteria bacterium]|nr:glycosyltransferase family 4 protein [Candidatus Moranbacteria bacterium]
MKKVLLFTRPLNPPWDEASKNLAYQIAVKCREKDIHFNVFTGKGSSGKPAFAENVTAREIFKKTEFDTAERARLLIYFMTERNSQGIIHFLFTPRPLTSFFFRLKLAFSKVKTIQTIATLSDNYFQNPKSLKKILFGDKIVAQSEYTFKNLNKAGFENLELVYPGIDIQKFSPGAKNNKLMRQLGIKNNDFTVLFAGEYTRLNAIDDIMEAFYRLWKRPAGDGGEIKLILACRIKSSSDRQKKEAAMNECKKRGFLEKVIFLDTIENMAELYRVSDINIFPAREMAGKFDIPLALVEAMAVGKPVIVSDIPVLQEFIKDGKTGIITPKASPENLEKNISMLKNNPEKYEFIAKNGIEFARKNFDIEKNIKKYIEIYRNI